MADKAEQLARADSKWAEMLRYVADPHRIADVPEAFEEWLTREMSLRPHLEPAAQSLAIYKCEDCGCTFAATICFPAKQLEHFQAAVGDDGTFINNCPHCGGTMVKDIGPKQPSTSAPFPAPQPNSLADFLQRAGKELGSRTNLLDSALAEIRQAAEEELRANTRTVDSLDSVEVQGDQRAIREGVDRPSAEVARQPLAEAPAPSEGAREWPKEGDYNEPCANCGALKTYYLFPCGDYYCWHCQDNRGRHDDCEKCLNAAALSQSTATMTRERAESELKESLRNAQGTCYEGQENVIRVTFAAGSTPKIAQSRRLKKLSPHSRSRTGIRRCKLCDWKSRQKGTHDDSSR